MGRTPWAEAGRFQSPRRPRSSPTSCALDQDSVTNATLAERGYRISSRKGAPANPNFPNSDGWTVSLSFQGRRMKLPFYQGSGFHGQPPTLASVIHAIVNDTFGYNNARDLEDWADDLIENPKPARKLYRQLGIIAKHTMRLLGSDEELAAVEEIVHDY